MHDSVPFSSYGRTPFRYGQIRILMTLLAYKWVSSGGEIWVMLYVPNFESRRSTNIQEKKNSKAQNANDTDFHCEIVRNEKYRSDRQKAVVMMADKGPRCPSHLPPCHSGNTSVGARAVGSLRCDTHRGTRAPSRACGSFLLPVGGSGRGMEGN